MARRTKEDAEKTRTALLDAAERVFLRRGFSSAPLDEIAKEAGVTRGALYWHFADKFAIFRAMHDRVKSPIDALFDQLTASDDPVAGLQKLCIRVLQTLASDEHTRNVFTIIRLRCEDSHNDESPMGQEFRAKRAQAVAKFEAIFKHAAAQHQLAPGMNAHAAALALHSYLSGIIWDYLRDPDHYPLKKLAPSFMKSFFSGLRRSA